MAKNDKFKPKIDFNKKHKDLEKQYRFVKKQIKIVMNNIEIQGTVVLSKSNGLIQNPEVKTYNDMLKHLLSINRQLMELKDLLDEDTKDGLSDLE